MKGVLPCLVCLARRASTMDFCPALAALVSPLQNITLLTALIKKKKIVLMFKEIQKERLLTVSSCLTTISICAFPHILGSPSLYMTLQPLSSEFPKFYFFFISAHTVSLY
jgi:hypothetical protein